MLIVFLLCPASDFMIIVIVLFYFFSLGPAKMSVLFGTTVSHIPKVKWYCISSPPPPPHPLPIFYTCLKRRAVGNWKSVHIPPDSLRPGARTFCFTRVSPAPTPAKLASARTAHPSAHCIVGAERSIVRPRHPSSLV